jgi:hypothetical protein
MLETSKEILRCGQRERYLRYGQSLKLMLADKLAHLSWLRFAWPPHLGLHA